MQRFVSLNGLKNIKTYKERGKENEKEYCCERCCVVWYPHHGISAFRLRDKRLF